MKSKIIITIALSSLAVLIACKSKKDSSSSATNEAALNEQLAAVKTRFPDATKEELLRGQAVYTGPCTKCHGTKDVMPYTEEKLLGIVDVMAKKAELTPEDKQALIRFAVGVRATAKK